MVKIVSRKARQVRKDFLVNIFFSYAKTYKLLAIL